MTDDEEEARKLVEVIAASHLGRLTVTSDGVVRWLYEPPAIARRRRRERQEQREQDLLVERPRRDYPQIAEALAWSPANESPSWMTAPEREYFWHQVAEANRQAVVDRDVARLRSELVATFSRPILVAASAIGRLQRAFRR